VEEPAVLRILAPTALVLCLASAAHAQAPPPRSAAPDTSQWDLQGNANPAQYLGKACLHLDGGAAILKNFTMRDAVIDVDAATPAARGFMGIQFRLSDDAQDCEWVYLRQHHSGAPDAMQYTPVLHSGANWQLYNGTGFTGAVDIPKAEWFHLRLVVTGAQAKFYVKDMTTPALVMDDLKSGVEKGGLALYVLTGETYFANVVVTPTPDAPWERHLPPMPPSAITKWAITPAYDALARDLERAPTQAERDTMKWQDVEAEPPGIVALYRYRQAPHLRVSFANDFTKRLEPQPGTLVLYARTNIDSNADRVQKLELGYSDEVSVFLNGKILYRGRSAQYFRDPAFLGIVNPENDAVYLPLKKGHNELLLAVSEIGGGWGFVARLPGGK
jgi:hypothetical protein